MAKTKAAPALNRAPARATHLARVHADGLLEGASGGAWLYRALPMDPVVDAISAQKSLEPGQPILDVLNALGNLAGSTPTGRRQIEKSKYRQIHLLRIRVPAPYTPPADSPIYSHLAATFAGRSVTRSVLLIGVLLRPTVFRESWRESADALITKLTETRTPISDYERDAQTIANVMARTGLEAPAIEDLMLAESWWNDGRKPDPPYLPHSDHIHLFNDADTCRVVHQLIDGGENDCTTWDQMQKTHSLSFATVAETDLPYLDPTDPRSQWAIRLLQSDAPVVSIRGLVEPPKMTREVLRRNRHGYRMDIQERAAEGKMDRAEQGEMEYELTQAESYYSSQAANATLIDASVLVAFTGRDRQHGYDPSPVGEAAGVTLYSMEDRQVAAWHETMLCSPVRSSPYLRDLPAQTIAYSGLPSLATVGDRSGAQLGLSETDRQPVFIDHMAASDEDSLPIAVFVGQSGSGKACTLDTVIPTPTGSTTFGEVRPGMTVFGGDGQPCTVTSISDITETPTLFEIEFVDGQTVKADADHQWVVAVDGIEPVTLEQVDADLDWLAEQATAEGRTHLTAAWTARTLTSRPSHAWWPSTASVTASLAFMDVIDSWGKYPAGELVAGLRKRAGLRASDPRFADGEHVLCTGEMIADRPWQYTIALPGPVAGEPGNGVDLDGYVRAYRGGPIDVSYAGSVTERRALLVALIARHGIRSDALSHIRGLTSEGVTDVLRIARSLGLVASESHCGSAVYVAVDEHGLPTGNRLRVEKIEACDPEPARCITVDSPDSTYLLAGHIKSHNTQTALFLADQYARMPNALGQKTPICFIDLKENSNHSGTVARSGGTSWSLDQLLTSDGPLDPIRFSRSPEAGANTAAALILAANPFGMEKAKYEGPLTGALAYGALHGGRCAMEALDIAQEAGRAPEAMVTMVRELAESNPQFRAFCGTDGSTAPLRMSEGITYIRLGSASLSLPDPDNKNPSLPERVSVALIRAMVYGSMQALSGRQGIVFLDEGWIFLEAGRAELLRAGRLAREWEVWLALFTQRIKEVSQADLKDFISRGGIMPMQNPEQARAACTFFGVDPNRYVPRITAAATLSKDLKTSYNWGSMRALIDPTTREVKRGSVMLYCDQHGRAVTTEVTIPKSFLDGSSTNRRDRDKWGSTRTT